MLLCVTFTTDPFLDSVTLVLVIATVSLAYFTARLHGATVELAKDQVKATRVSDRHHQEMLSPICVIRNVSVKPVPISGTSTFVGVEFTVCNQGNGPAMHINATVTPVGKGLIPIGTAMTTSPDSLKASEESSLLRLGAFPPREINMFLVHLEFRNQFGAWGVSEWNVYDGGYGLVKQELPAPADRV
jgi:hypothetical protein